MITKDREYRSFDFEHDDESMLVEGYAAVYDKPTVLFTDENGVDYIEEIAKGAFNETPLSDVVMNYNHTGKPVARTKNGTLTIQADDIGLHIKAYLGGTNEGRALYEEIKGGYIDKMSFCFDLPYDNSRFDTANHKRVITNIPAVYDVAAVDMPAYNDTIIYARNAIVAEAEIAEAEALKQAQQRKRIQLKLKLQRRKYHA